ncbi:rhodanese-like domain-containing protein [Gordonia amicalis]|uniref:sulfurtransferase n=1 Tax=Gordonia amicalis TaxID=89053 RepID=UPI002953A254|nr:rhodanese-like domain-containing protein [Gordonia amicalis]MDV7101067.1 rhodanese-like domain-containing protein [Gordonia amicalis]
MTGAGSLVSAEELSEHLDSAIILDASVKRFVDDDGQTVFAPGDEVFREAHIPGACFADLFAAFSDPDSPVAFTRPTADQMAATAERLGFTQTDHIVVYDQLSGAYAARVWLVLRSYGFDRARVLDGGFARWTGLGLPVATGDERHGASREPAGVEVHDISGTRPAFADLTEVYEVACDEQSSTTLVCALREPDYTGESGGERPGHIPGSLNVPFPDLLDDDGTFSAERTRSALRARGIDAESDVIVYCGGGINAAGAALAFVEAGLPLPRVYDGSLSEWRMQPDLPLVTGGRPGEVGRGGYPLQR